MSTFAIGGAESIVRTAARYADLGVLVGALAVFLSGSEPLLGWAAMAVAWPAQRAFQAAMESRAARAEDAQGFFRYMAGSLLGRVWIVVIAIFAVGIVDRPSGLAAAILAAILFTTYLILSLIFRPKAPST